jgi:pimeloyl-ACP methyl ester carboxylesterase
VSPALVIHGIEDEYGSPKHPQLIAELSGASVQLKMMDGTKHVPHKEKEVEVVRMVSGFLESLP